MTEKLRDLGLTLTPVIKLHFSESRHRVHLTSQVLLLDILIKEVIVATKYGTLLSIFLAFKHANLSCTIEKNIPGYLNFCYSLIF